MLKLLTPVAFALMVLTAGTAQAHSTKAGAALATYIPICKNSRGIPDRRACGRKNDPRRSQVAGLNAAALRNFFAA
jgi:hypothetical protein